MPLTGELTSLTDWIHRLLDSRDLRQMGHAQRLVDQNLGLGWLYYALARVIRSTKVVVIGSYRGFVPLVLARALTDNSEGGQVHFIDPSFVDDFWKNPSSVQSYFGNFGVDNITHYLMTTQRFAESAAYRQLDDIGIVFIDGWHSAEQASFDFQTFADKLAAGGIVLLHDSIWQLPSRIYGEEHHYIHDVSAFVSALKQQPQWQVFDLPFGDGVSLVRRAVVPDPPKRRSSPSI
jgi:predicted O-methyltransferase YrrM